MKSLALILLISISAGAAETDQYYAFGRPLPDSRPLLNKGFNLEIREALARQKAGLTCEKTAWKVALHLHKSKIYHSEYWAERETPIDTFPRPEGQAEYLKTGIYSTGKNWKFLDHFAKGADPTLEASGVRFGLDKLYHFVSVGALYYRVYSKHRISGAEAATRKAIQFGYKHERGILGFRGTGVFSFGDMDANYRGLMFYRELCEGPNQVLLPASNGKWIMTRDVDLNDFINPLWDESFNTSEFIPRREALVVPLIRRSCSWLNTDWYKARRANYLARVSAQSPTPNDEFLQGEIESGRLADHTRFSLERLCL